MNTPQVPRIARQRCWWLTRKGAPGYSMPMSTAATGGSMARTSRPHHQPPGARPARRPHAPRRREDRPPRADDLPLHRSWRDLAGSRRRRRVFGPACRTVSDARISTTRSGWRRRHASEPDVWYAGTSPRGLFRSIDGGRNWAPFSCINDDPQYRKWFGTVQDGTPDGPSCIRSSSTRATRKHLYFAMSGGGVHESPDGGESFAPLVEGMEVVAGFDAGNVAFQ